jgi:hypothetical protein
VHCHQSAKATLDTYADDSDDKNDDSDDKKRARTFGLPRSQQVELPGIESVEKNM